MSREGEEAALAYAQTRTNYFTNAQELIAKREFRKASELLWGAAAQEVKRLAALQNRKLTRHADLKQFVFEASKQARDSLLYTLFLEIETLHRNFYDQQIEDRDFPLYYEKVVRFIGNISQYTPR